MSLDNAERPCFHLKVITYRIYKHHELILLKLKTRGGREWDKKRWIATLAQGFSVCLILWQGAHHRKLIALLQRGCLVHIKTHEDTKQGSRQTLPGAAVFSVDTWKSNNYFYVVTNDIFVAIEFILRSVLCFFAKTVHMSGCSHIFFKMPHPELWQCNIFNLALKRWMAISFLQRTALTAENTNIAAFHVAAYSTFACWMEYETDQIHQHVI